MATFGLLISTKKSQNGCIAKLLFYMEQIKHWLDLDFRYFFQNFVDLQVLYSHIWLIQNDPKYHPEINFLAIQAYFVS